MYIRVDFKHATAVLTSQQSSSDLITSVSELLPQLLRLVCMLLLQILTSALMFRLQLFSQPLQPPLLIILDCTAVCIAFLS